MRFRWEEVADRVKEGAVVWAIDVAKIERYGVLMDSDRQVVVTVKWAHPAEAPALLKRLRGLACGSLMESTVAGTLQPLMKRAGR
jgi:hypothetical protein